MRYFTQCGEDPSLTAFFFMSGPQDESQILEEVKTLLERPGIKSVAVMYNHGCGERVDHIRKMPEEEIK